MTSDGAPDAAESEQTIIPEVVVPKGKRLTGSLVLIGTLLILVGLVDPLEGLFLIVPGAVLVTWAASRAQSRHRKLLAWGLGLSVLGIVVTLSLAPIYGDKGLGWWALVAVPYHPVGVLMLVGGTAALAREMLQERHPAAGNVVAVVVAVLGVLLIAKTLTIIAR